VRRVAPDFVQVRLGSHPKHLPLLRAVATEGARLAGFGEEDCERIALGVTEALTNVMRHGYGGDTQRPIELRLQAPPGLFRVEIDDEAKFVDPSRMRSRPLEDVRPGGLGLHLMHATMDLVEYRKNAHGGTTLTLTKRLPPEAPAAAPPR
jgi:anti-sigma regulatory factor (Ser/Thr protein kinase)